MSGTFDRKAFGERLHAMRTRAKLTQGELSRRIGVTFAQISHYENGVSAPSVPNLCALADALGVSTDELLGRRS